MISARLSVEGSTTDPQSGAEALEHALDNVVPADEEALAVELGRYVTIAHVPGEPEQAALVGGAHFHQFLGSGDNPQPTAVIESQQVTVAHGHDAVEIQQQVAPAAADKSQAPTVPVMKTQLDFIAHLLIRPLVGR